MILSQSTCTAAALLVEPVSVVTVTDGLATDGLNTVVAGVAVYAVRVIEESH